MALKEFISGIVEDTLDVYTTAFEYSSTNGVPNRSDSFLSFERGVKKKGKILKTCVLYVDIRNSVGLTQKHDSETMGKIYTAFAKAIIKAAKYHSGHVRNIIGDRVMIIFPATNCFTNAVKCAISINHISKNVISIQFPQVNFKCGIGIDYGEMKVIKVGVQRRGNEATENRSLVWTGNPANIASRLTDVANKKINETIFRVTRNKINPRAVRPLFDISKLYGGGSYYDPNAEYYLDETEVVDLSADEFANDIYATGEKLSMLGGKFISFEKKIISKSFYPILMTEIVYKGFKAENPEDNSVVKGFWKEEKGTIKNITTKVMGSDVNWKIN